MLVGIDGSLDGVDWGRAKADLARDDFDNGRSPDALRRCFEQSQHVVITRERDDSGRVVGTGRPLSDGVCNAYLLDVWTSSSYRRRGIASAMVRMLVDQVPGQHVGLQTDDARASTCRSASRPSRSSCRRWWGCGSTRGRHVADAPRRVPDGY